MNILSLEDATKKITEKCGSLGLTFINFERNNYVGRDKTIVHFLDLDGNEQKATYTSLIRCITGQELGKNTGRTSFRKATIDEAKQKLIDSRCPYDLSKFTYDGFHSESTFICHETDSITGKEHGEFKTIYSNVLKLGRGCPKCTGKYHWTVPEWVERAEIVHKGKGYDYSKVTRIPYFSERGKIPVICPEHGEFLTDPQGHIYKAYGCPRCSKSHGELVIKEYLDSHRIPYRDTNESKIKIGDQLIFPDFILDQEKIIIEYNGIQHYEWVKFFQKTYSDYEDQIARDDLLREYCKNNSYLLLEIPYVDFERIDEILDVYLQRDHKDITTHIDPDTTPPGSQ